MNKIKFLLISSLIFLSTISFVIANEFIGVVAVGIGDISNQKNEKLMAVRGNIYDRHNKILTNNIIHYSIGAHPSKVKDKVKFANLIASSTDRDVKYYDVEYYDSR